MRECRAHQGLELFLNDEEFETPFSFFYGGIDWMRSLNKGLSKEIIEKRNDANYNYYIIPGSNHNMFCENPQAMCNAIINDLFGKRLPVLLPSEYNK